MAGIKQTIVNSLFMTCLLMIGACTSNKQAYHDHLLTDTNAGEAGISITWLSVAGVLISDGKSAILIDPFVSRKDLNIGAVIFRRKVNSDPDAVHRSIERWKQSLGDEITIGGIIVSHSHYDHSLDAPTFSDETKAPIIGGTSTSLMFSKRKLEIQPIALQAGTRCKAGNFTITMIESQHGVHPIVGIRYKGRIKKPVSENAPVRKYRLGEVFQILIEHEHGSILHVGSNGFLPNALDGVQADVALLSASDPKDSKLYIENTAGKVGAELIIPMHFDNFFVALEPDNLQFQTATRLPLFLRDIKSTLDSAAVATLPIGEPRMVLPAKSGNTPTAELNARSCADAAHSWPMPINPSRFAARTRF